MVLIQEPQVAKGKVVGLEAGKGHIISDKEGKPRACIRTSLICWKKEELTSRDLAVAMVKTNAGQLCVASLYLDYDQDVKHEGFLKLTRFCKQNNLPMIVGMDSNAHSSMWGSVDDNNRGERLEELLMELNLHVLNQGNVEYISKSRWNRYSH